MGELSDPDPLNSSSSAFYVIREVALLESLDIDTDGIDDAYELVFSFLDPLSPSDAVLDFNNDGVSNLDEFL